MTGTAVAIATATVTRRLTDGFATGLVTVALVAVPVVVARRWRATAVPVAGLALAAAALVALERAGPATLTDDRLRLGIVLLALGPTLVALLADRRGTGTAITAALAAAASVPGALVIADAAAGVAPHPWIRPLVVTTVVVGGAAVLATDRFTTASGLTTVCLVGSLVACFTTVPDTEQAAVLAGVAIPFVLLGVPVALADVGPGAFAVVGLLAWTAAVGGSGRPGSALGAVAGLGVLLTLPVARSVRGDRLRPPTRPFDARWAALVALQAGTVLGTARIAGLRDSLAAAAVAAGVVLALGVPVELIVGTRNVRPVPVPYHDPE